jgi:hypothetical protein
VGVTEVLRNINTVSEYMRNTYSSELRCVRGVNAAAAAVYACARGQILCFPTMHIMIDGYELVPQILFLPRGTHDAKRQCLATAVYCLLGLL